MELLLKNKNERELFIDSYPQWEKWKSIPELGVVFYRWQFENGDEFIVTEYQIPINEWSTKFVGQKYHLMVAEKNQGVTDKDINVFYTPNYYSKYEPSGCPKSTIIDYLTKNRDNLESVTEFKEARG